MKQAKVRAARSEAEMPALVTFSLVVYTLGALGLLASGLRQPNFPWWQAAGTAVLGALAAGMAFRQNWARSLSALFWTAMLGYGLYALVTPPYTWLGVGRDVAIVAVSVYLATGMISVDVLHSFGVQNHWMLDLSAARQPREKKP